MSIHGEAFDAGISGRCAGCEQDKELEAENARLKKKLEQHRWIPVSERLPGGPGPCLILPLGRVQRFYDRMWIHSAGVTHWKPIVLPEPLGDQT